MAGSRNFGLNIFQWNCNGLSAHLNEFKQHLSNNSYDVICLQETFLNPSKNLSIDGYSMIRKDRIDMRKGGLTGLVTFIKDCLAYTEIPPPDDMKCILVKIKTENSYITVANVYISPNQTIDIDTLLDKDATKFWNSVYKISNNKAACHAVSIRGATGSQNVCSMWKEHFENLYNTTVALNLLFVCCLKRNWVTAY